MLSCRWSHKGKSTLNSLLLQSLHFLRKLYWRVHLDVVKWTRRRENISFMSVCILLAFLMSIYSQFNMGVYVVATASTFFFLYLSFYWWWLSGTNNLFISLCLSIFYRFLLIKLIVETKLRAYGLSFLHSLNINGGNFI